MADPLAVALCAAEADPEGDAGDAERTTLANAEELISESKLRFEIEMELGRLRVAGG